RGGGGGGAREPRRARAGGADGVDLGRRAVRHRGRAGRGGAGTRATPDVAPRPGVRGTVRRSRWWRGVRSFWWRGVRSFRSRRLGLAGEHAGRLRLVERFLGRHRGHRGRHRGRRRRHRGRRRRARGRRFALLARRFQGDLLLGTGLLVLALLAILLAIAVVRGLVAQRELGLVQRAGRGRRLRRGDLDR